MLGPGAALGPGSQGVRGMGVMAAKRSSPGPQPWGAPWPLKLGYLRLLLGHPQPPSAGGPGWADHSRGRPSCSEDNRVCSARPLSSKK